MRPVFGIACSSVASVFAVVQVLRFGFGAPMVTSAVVMLLILTVIFLVASAFLHHPTYDDAGPAAAVTLTTGIVIGLLDVLLHPAVAQLPDAPGLHCTGRVHPWLYHGRSAAVPLEEEWRFLSARRRGVRRIAGGSRSVRAERRPAVEFEDRRGSGSPPPEDRGEPLRRRGTHGERT